MAKNLNTHTHRHRHRHCQSYSSGYTEAYSNHILHCTEKWHARNKCVCVRARAHVRQCVCERKFDVACLKLPVKVMLSLPEKLPVFNTKYVKAHTIFYTFI